MTITPFKPFWLAVARLVESYGDQLDILHINGSPKGRAEPMPPEL